MRKIQRVKRAIKRQFQRVEKEIEKSKRRIARRLGDGFRESDVKIAVRFPEPGRFPTEADVRSAARVIQRFCNNRQGDTACKTCPIHSLCGTEPYSWVLPCIICGKESNPRIKCKVGPICEKCCESCLKLEPFPCPEYDAFKAREAEATRPGTGGGNNAL